MSFEKVKMKFMVSKKIIFASMVVLSANANAAVVLEHSAKVAASTEYHSNIQYLEKSSESVYIYAVTPEYQVSALDGVNSWFGRVGVVLQRSSNSNVSGRREDPFATVGWERELEAGKFGLTAEYLKSSTRIAQLFDTGLVTEDGTNVTKTINAEWVRNLTSKLDLNARAQYSKSRFNSTRLLTDFSVRELGAGLEYKFNEKLTPFSRFVVSDFRAVNRVKYQTYMVGSLFNYSPQLEFEAGAGITRFSTSDENEAVGFFQATYIRPRSETSVALSREAFNTGARAGSTIIGDRFTVKHLYELSQKNRVGAELTLSQNKGQQENQDFVGYFERDIAAFWLMRASIGLSNIKFEGSNSANNNYVGASLTYNGLNF